MLRLEALALGLSGLVLAGCGHSAYAVRPMPRIAADTVGKPVLRLEEAFGKPRNLAGKELVDALSSANAARCVSNFSTKLENSLCCSPSSAATRGKIVLATLACSPRM